MGRVVRMRVAGWCCRGGGSGGWRVGEGWSGDC